MARDSLYPVSGSKELLRFTANSESDALAKGFVSTDIDYSGGLANFNGSTSKVDTGSDMIGTKACTIVARIYAGSSQESGSGRILENGKTGFSVEDATYTNRLVFSSVGSNFIGSAADSIQPNTWYHIVVTRNSAGDETNFYINGVLSGSANQDSGTPTAGTSNVIIGNKADQSRTFDGDIDFVRVIDEVWTAKDVELDYKNMLYQPVQNAVVGTTDLVTNGDFSAWTADDPDGWQVGGESGTDPEVSEVGADEGHGGAGTGALNFKTTGAGIDIKQTILTVGKRYRMSLDVTNVVSGSIKLTAGDGSALLIMDTVKTYVFDWTTDTTVFFLRRAGACDITIDNVKVYELSDGCVGRWDLSRESSDGSTTMYDTSGFKNNGSITPGSSDGFVKDQLGRAGRAYDFHYTTINLGSEYSAQETTFMFWYKDTNTGTFFEGIFGVNGAGNYAGFSLASNGRTIFHTKPDGYAYFESPSGTILRDGNWHLVTLYIPGAAAGDIVNARLWIDKVEYTVGASIAGIAGWGDLVLGENTYGDGNFSMANFRIVNYFVSPTQSGQIYERERGRL